MPFGRALTRQVLLALLLIACSPGALFAQERSAAGESAAAQDQAIIDAARNGSEIVKNLGHLSDEIGPRLTGSAALRRANEWAAGVMKQYGLENVHQEGWTVPTGWERGMATARIVEPNNGRSLLIAARGWSPGTKGKVVGDVVVFEARTSKDFDKYRGKLKGAVVLRGKPAEVRPITDLSAPATASRARAQAAEKAALEQAAKQATQASDKGKGAAAKLQAQGPGDARQGRRGTPPEGAPFGQSRAFAQEMEDFLRAEGVAVIFQDAAKPQGLLVTTGSWRGADRVTAPEPLPAAYIAHEHYAMLYRLANRPAPAKTQVEVEITNKFLPGPITAYNTVGEIRGAKKPDEFVILGAHIDSWDLATGTTDNGTGTCIVLEAARVLKKLGVKPDRTIRFVLFSGEEQGLHGSRAYVQQHKDELPKISMCLVHDTGTGKVQGIGLQGREVLKPIFERELAALKPLGVTNISLSGIGATDHASFDRAGVPGFSVIQDMSEYRFTHHTQTDTLDKVHPENLIQGAQVLAVSAVRVANFPTLLPRERPERPHQGGDSPPAKKGVAKGEEAPKPQ